METKVVRLKRSGGEVIQGCDVYIGRQLYMGGWRLPKSKWHNPYSLKTDGTREEVLRKYREYILASPLMNDLEELRGKVLGCWCHPEACHGDVLVELLNK